MICCNSCRWLPRLSHPCSYNISLTAGLHAIAVILSNGMYNVRGDGRYTKFSNSGVFGPRTLWLSIDITLPDGQSIPAAVVSDTQWLCDPSGGPLTFSHAYGGEDWDAALEESGWDQVHFNASAAWQPVQAWLGPGCDLVSSDVLGSPLHVRETLEPVHIFTPKGGGGDVYDFGRNFMGWPRMKVSGARGSVVRLVCGGWRAQHGW
jgi:alpha-L-rhamnosidase